MSTYQPRHVKANMLVQCRNDGGRLPSFEPEEVGLDITNGEFSVEDSLEEDNLEAI